ncbi:transposase [Allofrancisella guangzhouensis]|nr:transposase [Allofrancisella guangzhouensis]MBK2043944.1 transposase [Allofrancisella guangzhouensis]MBK2044943.1 transposase [Allofrancisella guangzhouensis]
MEYYISESNWSTILTFLTSQKGLHTKDTVKLRKFIEAVFFILKTGAQWKYLHKDYGNSRAPSISVINTGLIKVFGII